MNTLHVLVRRLLQVEVLYQQLQCLVLRAVVDDDHLEVGVIHLQQRLYVIYDGFLLVVRTGNHTHTRRKGTALHGIADVVVRPLHVLAAVYVRQNQQHDVRKNQRQRVEENQIAVYVQYVFPHNVILSSSVLYLPPWPRCSQSARRTSSHPDPHGPTHGMPCGLRDRS